MSAHTAEDLEALLRAHLPGDPADWTVRESADTFVSLRGTDEQVTLADVYGVGAWRCSVTTPDTGEHRREYGDTPEDALNAALCAYRRYLRHAASRLAVWCPEGER